MKWYIESTTLVIDFLKTLFKTRLYVTGLDTIPDGPILFVANHFTRFETAIIPYLIHKETGKTPRSLADEVVFVRELGDFLRKIGTISTANPNRDHIILSDLMTGSKNWLIYPEGIMVKNKKIRQQKNYKIFTPQRKGLVHTGAAVLALKAELLKREYQSAKKLGRTKHVKELENDYCFSTQEIDEKPLSIVPISISYFPIFPKDNFLKKVLHKVFSPSLDRHKEEIDIESSMLTNSDINVHFAPPIYVKDFIKTGGKTLSVIQGLSKKSTQVLVDLYKYPLTTRFMNDVYNNIHINLQHLYALILSKTKQKKISREYMCLMVYSLADKLISIEKYRLHPSVMQGVKILFPTTLKDCTDAALRSGILKETDKSSFVFSKKALNNEYDFHTIRLKNILKVQLNELRIFKDVQKTAESLAKKPVTFLKKQAVLTILDKMLLDYEADYKKYYSKKFSKPKQIGSPYFLKAQSKKIGVVLCHGYKASPAEVHLLAKYLNKKGYNVLVPRLKGHGTAPINLKDVTYQDWQESLDEAYAVLRQSCDKVVLVGFSTGGLLSLCCAAQNYVDGIVCVNAALKLNDIRMHYIGAINFWHDLLKIRKNYIDTEPEYPHTNYSRNYLKGVEELSKLMKETDTCAPSVACPALIIQGKKDPIVNPKSGQDIYSMIKSKTKYLYEPDLDHHVIVRGTGHEEVFETIYKFIHTKIN